MNAIQSYLLAVTATAILVSVIGNMISHERIKKVASYAGSIVLILSVLSPVFKLDETQLKRALSELRMETELRSNNDSQNRVLCTLIKERCEAYILDKTETMGIQVVVSISVEDGEDFPHPSAAILSGDCSLTEREQVMKLLEEDLGIPREKQKWE